MPGQERSESDNEKSESECEKEEKKFKDARPMSNTLGIRLEMAFARPREPAKIFKLGFDIPKLKYVLE